MATPTGFPECNGVLNGGDDPAIMNLPVYRNGVFCLSVWELTPEEVAQIVRDGRIALAVFAGTSQPPVYLLPYVPGIPKVLEDQITG